QEMTSMLAAGQVLAARYELVRPLAAGHDPSTWLARDRDAGREVVLRVRGEVGDAGRLPALIRHPALLAPVASGRADDRTFDVFEYLPGGEIGRLRGRPWPLLVRRLLPVVDALAQVHDAGWVHGDVKSANVLLDADGLARLADFGSARRIGETAATGASPYSVSPERLDGAAAAAADDVYAFGVLLYELVSGHPPFYPDLTPARVREETPAPLAGRPSPPEALRALVARCLAKDPGARPATMREVRAELEHCLSLDAPVEPADGPGFNPRPPADATPIRAQWQRSAASAPSAGDLRREGFRRGLLVGGALLAITGFAFTFFVLPDLVDSRTPTTTPAPAPATPAEPAPAVEDLAKLAELKRQAEQRRADLPERLRKLQQRDVESWGGATFAQARTALAAGDAAMEARDFKAALAQFTTLATALDALEQRAPKVVDERLAAARTAFDAGRSAEAREKFAAVLKVDPQNAAAKTGLQRSQVLDAVLRETAAGEQAEQAGDKAGAMAAYQRALRLDPATTTARASLARLQAQAAGDAYSAAIAQAQAALARGDQRAAQAAFERAGRIRPGSPEVAEGLQQIRRAGETQALASTLERAMAAERAEQWSEAVSLHREALKAEPTLVAAQQGLERAEPRAMLDAELQSFLDRPERLYSPAGREVARNVLERAGRVAAPGQRLQAQVTRLQDLLRQAETPIRVALASDNATEVQIYRIGKLGLFEQKDLELMPGRYTVVGTRQGYRDVRKELNLMPGASPPTLVVRCEERI
ncbi:MAG TPA: protein kinase, partial [Steroidobacteraceae bacterium]|nr:protein kinase [Steroidobacteraceae bacterium]